MSNELYHWGATGFGTGAIDWVGHDIRAVLVDSTGPTGYSPDIVNHRFLSSVPPSTRIATAQIANRIMTGGIADASDVTFPSVPADRPNAELLLIYRFVTGDADSLLIAKIDSATNLPIQANGGNLTVEWNNSPSKIFSLRSI